MSVAYHQQRRRRLRRLAGAALRARVGEVARLTGLPPELLGRFPHQLSGGQKARVGIARAIAVEPRLLILDEPTSALDVSVQAVILQLLDDLKLRLGLSYLFVSHDLNVVRLLCDRILVMYLGHIVESGPADQVFAAPAHPYTKALLSAVPSIGDRTTRERRLELPGEPRSPIDPDPNVCPLYGRCFRATDACKTTMPALREVMPGRRVACHFPIVEGFPQPFRTNGRWPSLRADEIASMGYPHPRKIGRSHWPITRLTPRPMSMPPPR